MERQIRNSAKALVINDGKMLALKLTDETGDFYIMPGGGQLPGETLIEAARREVAEETGLDVAPREAVFIIEGVRGESFQRVDIVFLCDYIGKRRDIERHFDNNQRGVEWLEISRLSALPLYPSKLRKPIMRLFAGEPRPVYLGNEEIGDPEEV